METVRERKSEKTGAINLTNHIASGPPPSVTERCKECGGKYHVCLRSAGRCRGGLIIGFARIEGPLWNGTDCFHDPAFVGKMIAHVKDMPHESATAAQPEKMLSVAQAVLGTTGNQ